MNRDLKSRTRDDGGGLMRTFSTDGNPREGSRREELLDVELMEKLKQGLSALTTLPAGSIFLTSAEFGDPFEEDAPNQTTA